STSTDLYNLSLHDALPISSSADPQEALAKLHSLQPGITNFSVIEVRRLSAEEQSISRSLTNSAVAVVATESGQRIVHLRPMSDRSEEHTSELQSLRHLVCR